VGGARTIVSGDRYLFDLGQHEDIEILTTTRFLDRFL
jgi:hypothetical protein